MCQVIAFHYPFLITRIYPSALSEHERLVGGDPLDLEHGVDLVHGRLQDFVLDPRPHLRRSLALPAPVVIELHSKEV